MKYVIMVLMSVFLLACSKPKEPYLDQKELKDSVKKHPYSESNIRTSKLWGYIK